MKFMLSPEESYQPEALTAHGKGMSQIQNSAIIRVREANKKGR